MSLLRFYAATHSNEPVDGDASMSVAVHHTAAQLVLDSLQLLDPADPNGGLQGVEAARNFLGRVLLARVLAPYDGGLPVIAVGSVIEAGRPKGYLQTVLDPLETLAQWAVDNDCQVAWS